MLKICKIKDCPKKYFGRGYCQRHYARFYYYPIHKDKINTYHKEWRRKRYGPLSHLCSAPNCKKRISLSRKFCYSHNYRFLRNLPLDLTIKCSPSGERNFRWNGGTSAYPDHYLMKKNRLSKLKQTNGKCEICKKEGEHIHHIDGSKNNHSFKNLILLCHKCHGIIHSGRHNKTSKFIRLYGMTTKEMSRKYGSSEGFYWSKHQKNELKDFLRGFYLL